ncbi:MAG: hypothetical protein INH37_21860, partial [Myxococcaceae bacterium]|nr:hypothetical protein [Myxococcaceae bacterium]
DWLAVSWLGPAVAVVVASRWLAPGLAPLVLATAGVVAGAAAQARGRAASLRTVAVVAAVAASAWHGWLEGWWPVRGLAWLASSVSFGVGEAWRDAPAVVLVPGGVTLLVSALAVGLVARASAGLVRQALEALGVTLAVATLLPVGLLPWPSALVPQLVVLGLVTLASAVSVARGRAFRWAYLAAAALFVALFACSDDAFERERLFIAALAALLATPALLPLVTLPLAGALACLFVVLGPGEHGTGFAIVALAAALLGLLERVPSGRRVCFNGAPAAWPAIATSALALVPALASRPRFVWVPVALGVLAPQLWAVAASRRWLQAFTAPLAALGAAWSVGAGAPAWLAVAPLASLALTVLARPAASAQRDPVFDRLTLILTSVAALGTAAWSAGDASVPPALVLPWALALLPLPVGALAVRLGVAAAVVGLTPAPGVVGPAVAALLAVGFAQRHAPERTAAWLGARSTAWVGWASAASALALAAQLVVRAPTASSQAVLVGALAASAVLVGALPLLTAALALAPIALPRALEAGQLALWPWAPAWAGLVVAAAAALRAGPSARAAEGLLARLGGGGRGLASWVWGAGALVVALAVPEQRLLWAVPALGLLWTPRAGEALAAATLTGLVLATALPLHVAAALIGALGAALAWLGALRPDDAAAPGRTSAGWVLALASLALSLDVHAWGMPVSWCLAAVTAWAVQRAHPSTRWVAWAAVWAASHAVLAWAGVALSSGAPKVLILPWFGLASTLVAIGPTRRPEVPQHAALGVTFRVLALMELGLGWLTCPGGRPAEALAVIFAVGVALWLAFSDAKEGEPRGVWLGALAASVGFTLARLLVNDSLMKQADSFFEVLVRVL